VHVDADPTAAADLYNGYHGYGHGHYGHVYYGPVAEADAAPYHGHHGHGLLL
jgi:hypothetical protein